MEFRLIHCLAQCGETVPAGVAHEEFAARLADMPVTLRETAEPRNGIHQRRVRIGKFSSHSNSFPVKSFQLSMVFRQISRGLSTRKNIELASAAAVPYAPV